MSIKTVTIKGFALQGEQFVIKTDNNELRIGANVNDTALDAPSPVEYILAGYAGCISAVGNLVAKELNLNLKSLQVDISGDINIDIFLGKSIGERAGFNGLQVTIKPEVEASEEQLQNWLAIVESRCPVYDNLYNKTPIKVNLVSNFASFETV